MDVVTKRKWDRAAGVFDLMNGYGPDKRWAPVKREFYSAMRGKILFLAVGTGLDIQYFPPQQQIVGIDISDQMLEQARPRARAYPRRLDLRQLDVHEMDYAPGTFDQIFTSCTFCSVPDPVRGLEALRKVLKPGGALRMLEHTGSRYFPFNLLLNLMNPVAKLFGPEVNRDTVANVERAGFRIAGITLVYLDIVKLIHAVAPAEA